MAEFLIARPSTKGYQHEAIATTREGALSKAEALAMASGAPMVVLTPIAVLRPKRMLEVEFVNG